VSFRNNGDHKLLVSKLPYYSNIAGVKGKVKFYRENGAQLHHLQGKLKLADAAGCVIRL